MAGDRWLVVLGGGRTQLPFVQAAVDRGLSTLVVDRDAGAPAKGCATRFHALSLHESQAIGALVHELGSRVVGTLAYTADPRVLATAGRLNGELGSSWFRPRPEVARSDKALIQSTLSERGIRTPDFAVVATERELRAFLEQHPQAVLKPQSGGRGSAGVARVAAGDDVGAALRAAVAGSDTHHALAEAFVEAPEFTVDGLVAGGVVHVLHCARKHHLAGGVLMRGFSSGPDATRAPVIAALAHEALAALRIDDSFFSLDVLDAPQGPCVIDAGVLMDAKVETLLAFAGIDVYGLTVELMCGARPTWPTLGTRGHALRFLYAAENGVLRPRDDREVRWERRAGDAVRVPGSVADVVGWLMASAESAEDAWRSVCAVPDESLFEVTP